MEKEKILVENNLQIVESEFFRGKSGVSRVKNKKGEKLILKTEGIEKYQVKLFKIAKEMEGDFCFKVPKIIKANEEMILMEEVEGKSLNEYIDNNPDFVMDRSKEIADDYQKVIGELLKNEKVGNLLEDGEKWVMSKTLLWGGPIVESGLLKYENIRNLADELEEIIKRKGESFFGWMHGNIIGDHVIVDGDDLYLLDLDVVIRAGHGYYDFLRAIDFAFLKTTNAKEFYEKISGWIGRYLPQENQREVKLVLASRMVGILGWDILYHKVEYVNGNLEEKKKLLIKMIKER